MSERVKMIRTIAGEFIMGYDITPDNMPLSIQLKNSRVFNIQMTAKGAAIGFLPVYPFTQTPNEDLQTINLSKNIVMLIVDEDQIDTEIVNGYKSNVSGIKIASKPQIVV